jgi:hypothetical protein
MIFPLLVLQLGLNSSLPHLPAVLSISIPTGRDACEYCPLVDPAPAGGRAVNLLKPNKHIKDKKNNGIRFLALYLFYQKNYFVT